MDAKLVGDIDVNVLEPTAHVDVGDISFDCPHSAVYSFVRIRREGGVDLSIGGIHQDHFIDIEVIDPGIVNSHNHLAGAKRDRLIIAIGALGPQSVSCGAVAFRHATTASVSDVPIGAVGGAI